MDAVEFLRDFRRMCSSYGGTCTGCELKVTQCGVAEKDCNPEKVIRVVEEWAKEHPEKTRLSEFVKLFPNASVQAGGCPDCCVIEFDSKQKCVRSGCLECRKKFWFTPIEEEEE